MFENEVDEQETPIDKLPDSDPFPEILVVEQSSGSGIGNNDQPTSAEGGGSGAGGGGAMAAAAAVEEEEMAEEEQTTESPFSTIPDSTPNSEEDFQNMNFIGKPDAMGANAKTGAANARRQSQSRCCLLV